MARDADEAVRYLNDPLNSPGNLSAFTALEAKKGLKEVWDRKSEISVPTIAFHGELDRVCRGSDVRRLLNGCADATYDELPGFWHTCLHDKEWRSLALKMSKWMDEKRSGHSSTPH